METGLAFQFAGSHAAGGGDQAMLSLALIPLLGKKIKLQVSSLGSLLMGRSGLNCL